MKTILFALALFAGTQIVGAQGTAFTYQGRLNAAGTPASGGYDLVFTLFDAGSGGSAVPGPLTNSATAVSNGLFTVTLDFGGGAFDGNARWLEIAVRTNGASGFVTLAPRQPLTPAPYAILAGSATTAGSVPASAIGGGTANISITGNAGTATSAAYAGSAAMAYTALTATTAATATNLIGNVADAQLSPNIARLNGTNGFTGTNSFAGVTVATNVNNILNGSFIGNGGGLTNLNTAQFANSVLTNGETGVTLDGAFSGSGAGLTSLNASQLASGTVPLAQLPGAVLTNGQTGTVTLNGNLVLPVTTGSAGVIYSGSSTLIESLLGGNFFAGAGAGNPAMSGCFENTGVGYMALAQNTNGNNNTANGASALRSNTSGTGNTASGVAALTFNTTGNYNTANGATALNVNTNGTENTADGYGALASNTSGSFNTAQGFGTLYNNTVGSNNIALGFNAGYSITTGSFNIDIGNNGLATDANVIRIGTPGTHTQTFIAGAITGNAGGLTNINLANVSGLLGGDVQGTPAATVVNTVGGQSAANVASGVSAANAATSANTASTIVKRDAGGNFVAGTANLAGNLNLPATTASAGIIYSSGYPFVHAYGTNNFFAGLFAGNLTMSGFGNTAVGSGAFYQNTSGQQNTAIGNAALYFNTNGNWNTALGTSALDRNGSGTGNTACGYAALFANMNGTYNIGLGFNAGANLTTGNYNIDIGNYGTASDNNIIRIGTFGTQTAAYIAGTIYGDGGGLTNLNAAGLSGAFTGNVIGSASTATNFSGLLSGDVTGTQSATVVSSVGGQTAANVAGGTSAANAATSANTASTIVKRDASGNLSAGTVTLNGNLSLPGTTATAGTIYLGGSPLIHTYGNCNFFAGANAGNFAVSGGGVTGIGWGALQHDTSGNNNTANGYQALSANTNGSGNTAIGFQALNSNTSGSDNTASGQNALASNTSGCQNTATGSAALTSNTNGWQNTADGFQALFFSTSGSNNVASGYQAMHGNITGFNNSASGYQALHDNTNGANNIALGYQAGYSITGNNNIDIGNTGTSSDNGVIRLGTPGTHTNTLLTGNVGIGTTSPGEALEVYGANVAMRLRNSGDAIGAFLGDTCSALQLGLYNPTASANGVIPANTRLSLFGMSNNGFVGSLASNYGCPTFRNLLDDGNGNMGLGTTTPAYKLDVVGDINASGNIRIGGVIKVSSDRNVKENFTAINPRTVLDKVTALPITEWKYKAEADGSKHLGPMAQDFHAAFGLNGADDKHIATVDESGVALAAIQGLNQKVESENAALRAENAGLKARLEKLENLMSARNGGGQ